MTTELDDFFRNNGDVVLCGYPQKQTGTPDVRLWK